MTAANDFEKKLTEQLDEESKKLATLNSNIANAEAEVERAHKEKDQRIGRISLLQEQISDLQKEKKPQRKSASK